MQSCSEHALEFRFIAWHEHCQIGYDPEEGQIESTVMRGSVRTDQSGPVYGKNHRQILEAYIVDQLVIRALQERRIYGHYRALPGRRQTGGESHRM